MKILYLLSYKSPNYIRTTTLIDSFNKVNDIKFKAVRNKYTNPLRYIETFVKYVFTLFTFRPNLIIVGFRGHEIFFPVKLFALRTPIIFDEFVSPWDSFVNERKKRAKNTLLAKSLFSLEKLILKNSTLILTDTQSHKDYFSEVFNIPSEKFAALYIGADETFQVKSTSKLDSRFNVVFYGTMLPLHGIETIIKAAEILNKKEKNIHFVIIGSSQRYKNLGEEIQDKGIHNVEYHKWVRFNQLEHFIQEADLCLGGPFGNTPQANRVISGKTFQFIAMGKPCIVGQNIEHSNLGFVDHENSLIVAQSDAEALAEKILYCFKNQSILGRIGDNARKLYDQKFSSDIRALELSNLIKNLSKRK